MIDDLNVKRNNLPYDFKKRDAQLFYSQHSRHQLFSLLLNFSSYRVKITCITVACGQIGRKYHLTMKIWSCTKNVLKKPSSPTTTTTRQISFILLGFSCAPWKRTQKFEIKSILSFYSSLELNSEWKRGHVKKKVVYERFTA